MRAAIVHWRIFLGLDETKEVRLHRPCYFLRYRGLFLMGRLSALISTGYASELRGVPATEAVQTAVGLESVIENRGRTVTPDSSARFGTGRVFGGFGR